MTLRAWLPLALLLGAVTPLDAAEAPLSVTLTVDPSRTLQGIPVSIRLAVSNEGDSEVVLPEKLLLRVVPSVGQPYIAEWGFGQEQRFSRAELPGGAAALRIPSHGRQTFAFNAGDIYGGAGWFVDPRMHIPGTYRLQVLFTDPFSEEQVFHTPAVHIESEVPVRLASTEAVLTVNAPEGDDALAWKRLLEIARWHDAPSWSMMYVGIDELAEFAKEAVEQYPRSAYTAYVVGYHVSVPNLRRLEAVRHVLDVQPKTPNREYLRLFAARMEERLIWGLEVRANPKLAIEWAERARADFAALEREATDPEIRKASRIEREKLPTAEELQQQIRDSAQR